MLSLTLAVLLASAPQSWIPARWEGAGWQRPSTLSLLEGSPINCLLVSYSEGRTSESPAFAEFVESARARKLVLLGLVHPGADPEKAARAARAAGLEGLVLDGDFPAGWADKLPSGLLAIPIAKDAPALRGSSAPVLALQGAQPGARNISDEGVRAGASAQPWIDSNVWLTGSFRLGPDWRPVWIDQKPAPGSALRSVADAALSGGRWIVNPDDELRAALLRRDPAALDTWRSINRYLQFAEEHAAWRAFQPYGRVAMILGQGDQMEEYLNLVARRHIPYRLLQRSQLNSAALADYQTVVAVALDPPTDAEKKTLFEFARRGGLVVAGPSWGGAPQDDPYLEVPEGKGRIAVYKDPDPESVAKDLEELLEPEAMGLSVFNVSSVITYASASGSSALIQLLNYAPHPFDSRITLRLNGTYRKARIFSPDEESRELPVRPTGNGRTELSIPRLAVWAAVLME